MAPRPNWKGFLKLSLVSCSVALYPATTTSQRVRFNIINRETGNRIRNEVVDAETGEPVEQEDRVKGYQFEKGQYILLEEDELDNVALESTHTIDIEQFVPVSEVDRIYLDEDLLPRAAGRGGAGGLRRHPRGDAQGRSGRPGARRDLPPRAICCCSPRAARGSWRRRCATTPRCATKRTISTTFPNIKVPADMLKLAVHILESKKGTLQAGQIRGPLRECVEQH